MFNNNKRNKIHVNYTSHKLDANYYRYVYQKQR